MAQNKIFSKICGLEFGYPLLCPPVLEQIFNHLELKDLKTCRFVCQPWNIISLHQMKSSRNNLTVQISLTHEDRLKNFLNNETGFSEFQHFKFIYSMELESMLTEFMKIHRIHLKHVTFVVGKNDDVNLNLYDKFFTFLAENTKNWETFGIEINKDSSQVSPTMDFGSLEINWTKCKSLGILNVKDSPIFLWILEKACQLERLVIIGGPQYSAYQSSLQKLITTLIELELVEYFVSSEPEDHVLGLHNIDNLPQFIKLKRLKIIRMSPYRRRHGVTIPSLPELIDLYLAFDSIDCPCFEEDAFFPKLKYLDWNFWIQREHSKKFPDMFPNLKRFNSNNFAIYRVWKYLRGIEEFNCSYQRLSDAVIIGFENPDLLIHPHEGLKGYVGWTDIYDNQCNRKENNQSDGIQVLSELKRITIPARHISNASIIFGLLKCKSLRSVRLVNPSYFLTKEILKWMADELNLMNLSIEVTQSDWLLCQETNYFRQKHPNCQLVIQYSPSYNSHLKKLHG